MPRKIDDVIVPDRKRTIRDIPIPQRRSPLVSYERPRKEDDGTVPAMPQKENKKVSRRSKKKLWLVGGFLAVALVFAALSIFNGATLAYMPKSAKISFSGDIYTARKTGDVFPYSVVKISKEQRKTVPASGTAEVSRKASGVLVVYNNASAEPQRLVENTRFQTPSGKVYRIKDAINIPGRKTVSGTIQPGSLEVTVYADEAGDSYNIGLSDFTLPGLAGTPRFQTIYARSKTPMSGGFVGRESVVSDADKTSAEAELQTSLREELMLEAMAQVPEGFTMFPSLASISFETLPQESAAVADSAQMAVRGDFTGVMFKESDLSNHLAQSKITLGRGESVDIVPITNLAISFAASAPRDLVSANEISLSVTGEVQAVWRTDEVALKRDLAGKNKSDIPSVLNNYPTVVSATTTIKPFWKSAFPSDSLKITIKKLPIK